MQGTVLHSIECIQGLNVRLDSLVCGSCASQHHAQLEAKERNFTMEK